MSIGRRITIPCTEERLARQLEWKHNRPSSVTGPVTRVTGRKHNAKPCWWVASFVVTGIFFLRGQHLLGLAAGVVFALIAIAIAVIGYRNLYAQAPSRTGRVLYLIFAAACAAIMFTPATFSPDLQHSINKRARDRSVRAELNTLIRSDAEYSNLRIETKHLKVIFVSISGTVPSRPTIDRLLADLSRLEYVGYCILDGRVVARDTGMIHEFSDDDLDFGTSKAAGNHRVHRKTRAERSGR